VNDESFIDFCAISPPDTEPVYEGVFKEVCAKYGKELTPEARVKLLGSTERRSCEVCVTDLKLNCTLDQFIADFRALTTVRLASVEFMPGAERLIRHLHASKVPICVATSSGGESVALKTKHHQEVFQLFHHITMGTDPEVKEGKPAPDIFLLAASRFDPKADPKDVSCRVSHQTLIDRLLSSVSCSKTHRTEFKALWPPTCRS
jgi:pseudouridine 5'-phosphatase